MHQIGAAIYEYPVLGIAHFQRQGGRVAHLGARPAAGLSGVHQQAKFAAGQALVAAALGIAHHIFSVEPDKQWRNFCSRARGCAIEQPKPAIGMTDEGKHGLHALACFHQCCGHLHGACLHRRFQGQDKVQNIGENGGRAADMAAIGENLTPQFAQDYLNPLADPLPVTGKSKAGIGQPEGGR